MPGRRLLTLLVVTALTALLPGTWTAAVAADPGSAPVSALPFVGSTGGAGTAAGNDAVSARCNAGAPLRDPQWFALPASDGGSVYARATSYQYGRIALPVALGLAFVDRATGAVIRCSDGVGGVQLAPLAPPSTQQVDVVAFYPKPYDDPTGDGVRDTLRVLLDRTSGSAPANDTWQAARPITALPLHQTVDTTLADDDSAGFGGCYWRPLHTVWWKYTPTAPGRLHTSVGSDLPAAPYEAFPGPWLGVARLTAAGPVPVVPGGPTADQDCIGPVTTADVRVEPGTTYLIGAFAAEYFQEPALALGGRLTLDASFVRDTAPTAPTGVLVHRDDRARTATLTWTPPSSDGGSSVTGYKVARDGTDTGGTGPWSTVLPATARTVTFKYLLPWRSYHLSVRAINAIGTGPAAGGTVMLTAPTASEPRSVTATAGNRRATVRWTAPAHTGSSAVKSYRIRRYAGSTKTLQATSTVSATARSFTALNLTNGKSYSFDVTAVNASGAGLVSARTKPVTPAP